MSFGNFAKNIYNGNISLDAAKQKQRKMENMLEGFMNSIRLRIHIKMKKQMLI